MANAAVRRVLLVDDDERGRRTRALMLVTNGYLVDTISSFQELDHPGNPPATAWCCSA